MGAITRIAIAAALLIREYSFFEAAVISLLIMIFSLIALQDAEGVIDRLDKNGKPTHQIVAAVKMISYGLTLLMALARIVYAWFTS